MHVKASMCVSYPSCKTGQSSGCETLSLLSFLLITDFKAELHAVNREVLFGFVELLAVLTERPSASARQIESLGIALRNQLHLCSLLRPHQVPLSAFNPVA